jgi:hypothetical protein
VGLFLAFFWLFVDVGDVNVRRELDLIRASIREVRVGGDLGKGCWSGTWVRGWVRTT